MSEISWISHFVNIQWIYSTQKFHLPKQEDLNDFLEIRIFHDIFDKCCWQMWISISAFSNNRHRNFISQSNVINIHLILKNSCDETDTNETRSYIMMPIILSFYFAIRQINFTNNILRRLLIDLFNTNIIKIDKW